MLLKHLLYFSLLIGFTPAFAQVTPSFDCGKAQNSAEELICKDPELAKLDRLVAARYADALEATEDFGSDAVNAQKELKAYQRGWVKGRDDCWKADDLKSCVSLSYQRREAELVSQYMLKEPNVVTTWQCENSPANEFVTYFFDTELPSVRIERGDRVSVGVLSRTASGSRYDADFGEFIWIKGDEALYRAPDPQGDKLNCIAVGQRDVN